MDFDKNNVRGDRDAVSADRRTVMDHRADDLTRLLGEIKTSRDLRETFLQNSKMAVRMMLDGFRRARADRVAFVSNLRTEVARLRQGFAAENASAHQAWFGSGGSKRGESKR